MAPEILVFIAFLALLQQVNRDTLSFAMKANAINFGKGWQPVYKKPITDAGKASKAGRQVVVNNNGLKSMGELIFGDLRTIANKEVVNLLEVVYSGGRQLVKTNFAEIRERAKI